MSNILYDALLGPQTGSDAAFLRGSAGGGLTYGEFEAMVQALCDGLSEKGIMPGDRVAAQIEKSPWALALYLATVRRGAVYLPLNTAYTRAEVDFFLSDCAPSCLFVSPENAAKFRDGDYATTGQIVGLGSDGAGDWRALNTSGTAVHSRAEHDLAALLYTSGTTGRPKGAMLSHANLLTNAQTLMNLWGFGHEDILLHALPVYHSHGLFVACNVIMLSGASMMFLPRFEVSEVLSSMPCATTMMGVPTFYSRLLDQAEFGMEHVRNMRLFISGSAPLLPQTHVAFEKRTGHRILERYGLTETSMNTSNPLTGERRPGTVGFPLPGVELRIRDQSCRADCAQGEIGEIQVRGPNVCQGYWGLPEETTRSRTEDGYFATGDLGVVDADGYVTIVGRIKDLIITGGLNVYPREIEEHLDQLDGVLESAVVGVPDSDFGERVVAIIVPEPGARPEAHVLSGALAERLARFKLPKAYHLVDELPRNALGKVQKNLLRDRFSE